MTERKPSRIQTQNREKIAAAALEVFARDGFRGATVDAIAKSAGMSKPNLLYYFPSKEEIYAAVLKDLMDTWLQPLRKMDAQGEPLREIAGYIERKIELARAYPMESRLFANEMLRGAPMLGDVLAGPLKDLVNETAAILKRWMDQGRLTRMDPRHLIFAIWAVTQHYADFDVQVCAVLGNQDDGRFNDAADAIKTLFLQGLRPR